MSAHLDLDRALESWLEEGPRVLPDRALDDALRRIATTSQRRPMIAAWSPRAPLRARRALAVGAVAIGVLIAVTAVVFVSSERPGAAGPASYPEEPIPAAASVPSGLVGPGELGFGNRLERVTPSLPAARVSPDEAAAIATPDFLAHLARNDLPQRTAGPVALVRRVYVTSDGDRQTVWVVLFRGLDGFDCFSSDGGPGPCEVWHAVFVDDQSGRIVGGAGLTDPG